MMNVSILESLRSGWPRTREVTDKELRAADDAVVSYPRLGEAWRIRGDLYKLAAIERCASDAEGADVRRLVEDLSPLQLGTDHPSSQLLDIAAASYKEAVDINRHDEEAWLELGLLYDSVDDLEPAERCLRAAVDIGHDRASFAGLARVLAQLGRKGEALSLLTEPLCPFSEEPPIQSRRAEILRGEWDPV